jgi:hypothetical protein
MSRWNSGIRRHTGAYSLLCEQQFGEGAEFDGEMCACRKGYVSARFQHVSVRAESRVRSSAPAGKGFHG